MFNINICFSSLYGKICNDKSFNPRAIFQKADAYHVIDRNRSIACITNRSHCIADPRRQLSWSEKLLSRQSECSGTPRNSS